MKPLATSTALHAALLTWGLWSFGSPPPLDMSASEALPVSLVPIEEYSQSVAGEEEAELTDTPAPEPTETPETLPMPAENVGDNEVDLASPPRPETAPRETVQTATSEAPPPPPPPAPDPEPEPEPLAEPTPPEPQPELEPEVAEPAPTEAPPPVIDEAAPEVAEAPPEPAPPQNVPMPQRRPTPPPQPTRTAEAPRETPQRQETPAEPEPEQEVTESRSQEEPEFDADEIAALLNREESAGGGAQRSEEQASLGGLRTTGATLTQSELDALRGQIQRCWSPPSGVSEAGSLRISIQMRLDPSGALQGMPQIVGGGGGSMIERVAGEAALRAVRRCAPYNLPIEKYETWSQVQINFDPSEMF